MTFDAIGISGTGLTAHRKWMDALSDNIANVNTVTATDDEAFRERFVLVETAQGTRSEPGVYVAGVEFGDPEGRMVYDPEHPLADDEGYVRMPDMNLSDQMTSLIMAQRGYQASAAAVDRAKTSYEAALQIGRN